MKKTTTLGCFVLLCFIALSRDANAQNYIVTTPGPLSAGIVLVFVRSGDGSRDVVAADPRSPS
jgi:hypothetical protein